VVFRFEQGDYAVETASTTEDLLSVLELRRHSFLEDFLPGANTADWIDFDEYDLAADHVLVKNRHTGEVLGAYRILCSKFTSRFYSEEQFDLGGFKYVEGTKIELGRACIHKEHRNGITLNLVWKGLGLYANLVKARFMFGCASIKTTQQNLAESLYWHLAHGHLDEQYEMSVLEKYQFPNLLDTEDLIPWPIAEAALPSLLRSYLMAGAKICSRPALDEVFQCVDFLTVLDLDQIDEKYERRYFK
jgi:putative hemolysin